ncbi:MAG: LysM domain-containing protein [Puniceicoccales bacterium]|jgi:LysM repeat protein|nr:LysM domain-containing protein [Puniceicoccales bacterium]
MDETQNLEPQGESKVPLIFAGFALVVAVFAIFFAIRSKGKVDDLEAKASAAVTSTALDPELKQKIEASSQTINARVAEIAALRETVDRLERELSNEKTKNENKFRVVVTETTKTFKKINDDLAALSGGRRLSSRPAPQPVQSNRSATTGTTAAAPVRSAGGTHKVKKGENFGIIAGIYGVSVAEIEAANPGVKSNKLNIGQTLKIPARGTPPAPRSTPPANRAPAGTAAGAPVVIGGQPAAN